MSEEKEWLRAIEIQKLYGAGRHASRDFASVEQKEWIFCGRKCRLYRHSDVKKIIQEKKKRREDSKKRWQNRPDVLRGTKSKIKKIIPPKMYCKLSHAWFGMMRRCYTDERPDYHHYREFGITVCDEWLNSFDAFALWALNNGVDYKLSLDRINNDMGYSPQNCRWTDKKTQGRNISSNVLITYHNRTQTMADWAEELGMGYHTLYNRVIVNKWSLDKAFKKPVRQTHLVTYQGKTQPICTWARELNLSQATLLNRYKKGWPIEKMFSKTKHKSNGVPV